MKAIMLSDRRGRALSSAPRAPLRGPAPRPPPHYRPRPLIMGVATMHRPPVVYAPPPIASFNFIIRWAAAAKR